MGRSHLLTALGKSLQRINHPIYHADCPSIRTGAPEVPAQTSDVNIGRTPTRSLTTSTTNVGEPPKLTPSTSQSSSALQGRPSSALGSTGQPAASTAASNTSDSGNAPASSGTKKIPIIIGVVIGVVVAAISIWLLWRRVKRRTSAAKEAMKQADEKWAPARNRSRSGHGLGVYGSKHHQRTQHRGKEYPYNDLLDVLTDDYYSAAGAYVHPTSTHHGRDHEGTNIDRGEDGLGKQVPYSPQSFLQPSVNDASAPSTKASPNNYGVFPTDGLSSEMSGESIATPELSPKPETSQINRSRPEASKVQWSEAGRGKPYDRAQTPSEANGMRPNLEIPQDDGNSGRNHVMSWMSYESGAASPTTRTSK